MTWGRLRLMFVVCATLGMINVILAVFAMRHANFQPPLARRLGLGLLRRYHPGAVLLVSAATGFGLGLPGTFLRPYAESMNIPALLLFSPSMPPPRSPGGFSRRLPARIGNRRVLYLGLAFMVNGMLLFTVASNKWLLCLPAMALGLCMPCYFRRSSRRVRLHFRCATAGWPPRRR